jgi:hypothetical protein
MFFVKFFSVQPGADAETCSQVKECLCVLDPLADKIITLTG